MCINPNSSLPNSPAPNQEENANKRTQSFTVSPAKRMKKSFEKSTVAEKVAVNFLQLLNIEVFCKTIPFLTLKEIHYFLGTCTYTNTTLRSQFVMRINKFSLSVFNMEHQRLSESGKRIAIELYKVPAAIRKNNSILSYSALVHGAADPDQGQRFFSELQSILSNAGRNFSINEIRICFGAAYFKNDEMAFMRHLFSYCLRSIYEKFNEGKNITLTDGAFVPEDYSEDFFKIMQENQEFFVKEFDNQLKVRESLLETRKFDARVNPHRNGSELDVECEDKDTSWLPIEIFENPERLTSLSIYGGSHALTLPSQIGQCVNLKSLTFEHHQIRLPSEIGKLTKLESLFFFDVYRLFAFPDEIDKLNLKFLSFGSDCSGDPCYLTKSCHNQVNFGGYATEACHIYFDDLNANAKNWIWDLKKNGCEIEGMYVPERS